MFDGLAIFLGMCGPSFYDDNNLRKVLFEQ